MNKRNEEKTRITAGALTGALLFGVFFLVGKLLQHKFVPHTLIGYNGLKEAYRYTQLMLTENILLPFEFALCGLVGSAVSSKISRNKEHKFSASAVITSAVLGAAVMMLAPMSVGILAEKITPYKSPVPLKRQIELCIDLSEDIESKSTCEYTAQGLSAARDVYRFSSKGSDLYYKVYHLDIGNEVTAELSEADSKELKDKLRKGAEHTVCFYKNSGLIASIDGMTEDFTDDFESMFKLSYENGVIRRNELPESEMPENLTIVTVKDGETVNKGVAGKYSEYHLPKQHVKPTAADKPFDEITPEDMEPTDNRGTSYYLTADFPEDNIYGRRVSNIVEIW